MKKVLPIGNDLFSIIRKNDWYYVDKSLMIKDFIEYQDTVALITRPRRFGKTLNMTMLREFFDITKDSRFLFEGLAIMDTEYAGRMNTRPVVYLSFKDCTGRDSDELKSNLAGELFKEYRRYSTIFEKTVNKDDLYYVDYYQVLQDMINKTTTWISLNRSISHLLTAVATFYGKTPILLIDEYDQPVLSSYENNYREELGDFFSSFYGTALKSNEYLSQALLTGIQRVAKESIFSKLNNVIVYTILDKQYAPYFGLTEQETEVLLKNYGMELTQEVKQQYDGYLFGSIEMYNPWLILNYVNKKEIGNYWINTSTNYLIKEALKGANDLFQKEFESLLQNEQIEVSADLELSFIELQDNDALWGLLINSGYVTVLERINALFMAIRIPNGEVRSELQKIVAEQANISNSSLQKMFYYLIRQDMMKFMEIYQEIVLSCTSYFDAKENAYHMLFLGMCISLRNLYKVTSNIESGHGRYDICLEALSNKNVHIIIEFKQGENLDDLKEEALQQILDNQYYAGLNGKILCIGIAHNKKHCAVAYKKL